ncbi:E3 ubiquitin-protein ligase TRIM56-like [Ptychodera flava]|uniref:E3 ubiquitin-protein ligase TRIM56-like n=1 Tax=Ptychodera flava TaxID=63121 RepID=UPI00396A0185
MAAEESFPEHPSEIDENFLLCVICSERYKGAKVLPCLHSFCEACLCKLVKKESSLTCPVCRRSHDLSDKGVAGISSNIFLNDLVGLFSERDKEGESSKCEGCEEGESAKHCIECALDVCNNCAKTHVRSRVSKSHRLVPLAEYNVAKTADPASVQPPIYCSRHPNYETEFYCDTCAKVICLKCTALDHRTHEYGCVKEAAEAYNKTLVRIVDKVKVKEVEADQSKANVQKVSETLDECYQREEGKIKVHIEQTIENMTRLIQENGDKILAELKNEYDTRKVNLNAQLKQLEIAEQDITSTREYIEKLKLTLASFAVFS